MLLLAQHLGLDLADALAREQPFLMPGARERKRARAAMEETGDGVRAWLYLKRVKDYEAAWRAQTALAASAPAFEPGPFPIRIQTPGDLHAARFDLLAWQDPHDTAGFPSPFWVQEGMVEAEPLVPLVATAGARTDVEKSGLERGGLFDCLSARRFNADRHANMLISRDYEGSIFDAVQQARRR